MTDIRMQKIHESIGLIHKNLECSICLEVLQDPVSTKCGHQFCRFCILAVLQTKPTAPCPLCKKVITKRGLTESIRLKEIVAAVNNVITAIEEDSGMKCSPPKGAVKLSQCSQPTCHSDLPTVSQCSLSTSSPHPRTVNQRKLKKSTNYTGKTNLHQSKSKCSTTLKIDDDVTSENQEPSRSNINISTSFPAPTKFVSQEYQENNGNEVSLLAALEKEPLRPSAEDVCQGFLDPYEFIASQRTPKKKPKRNGKQKHGNAGKAIQQKNIDNQTKDSRKANMKIAIDKIVLINGDNDFDLNIATKSGKQDILSDNAIAPKVLVSKMNANDINPQNGNLENETVHENLIDNKQVTEKFTEADNNNLKDQVRGIQQYDNNKKESNVDHEIYIVHNKETDENCIDVEGNDNMPKQMFNNKGNDTLFRRVYASNSRKSELPKNQKNVCTAVALVSKETSELCVEQEPTNYTIDKNVGIKKNVCATKHSETELPKNLRSNCMTEALVSNEDSELSVEEEPTNSTIIDKLCGKENVKLTMRMKMQKSLKQYGISENDAVKNTHIHKSATRKLDKTDLEIAVELAQEFGTLPKKLLNKRANSRKIKTEVKIQRASKSSNKISKPRKVKVRKSLLNENTYSNDGQIQEYSDSFIERETCPLQNLQNNRISNECNDQLQTDSTKTTLNDHKEQTNMSSVNQINSSPEIQRAEKVLPETPLFLQTKEYRINNSKDLEEEIIEKKKGNSEHKIHNNTGVVKMRSKSHSLVKNPRSNDPVNLDSPNATSSGQRRKQIRSNSNVIDTFNAVPEHCIVLSAIRNSQLSDESKIVSKEKNVYDPAVHSSRKDLKFIDCDTTDSIELSDIVYKDPPIPNISVKDFMCQMNNDSTVGSPTRKSLKETEKKEIHLPSKNVAPIVALEDLTIFDSTKSKQLCSQKAVEPNEGKELSSKGPAELSKDVLKNQSSGRIKQQKNYTDIVIHSHEQCQKRSKYVVSRKTVESPEPISSTEECVNQSSRDITKKPERSLYSNQVNTKDGNFPEMLKNTSSNEVEEQEITVQHNSLKSNNGKSKKDKTMKIKQPSPEYLRQLRRSNRKTFALGNTPVKEDCTIIKDNEVGIDNSKTDVNADSNLVLSVDSKSAELFGEETPYEISSRNTDPQQCINIVLNNKIEANHSLENFKINTNSDLSSSFVSTRRKSRERSRASQSNCTSPKISGNLLATTSSEVCKHIVVYEYKMAENGVPKLKMTGNNKAENVIRSSGSALPTSCIPMTSPGLLSFKGKPRVCSQFTAETTETTNHDCDEIIPASKSESQLSDKMSPPIIDYRPVMKKKRVVLTNNKNGSEERKTQFEGLKGRRSARIYSKFADVENKDIELKVQNNNLETVVENSNTTFTENDFLNDDSNFSEDEENLIPPTPIHNNELSVIGTTKDVKFNKQTVRVTEEVGTEVAEITAKNQESLECSHMDSNSLSVFREVLAVEKLEPMSPSGCISKKLCTGRSSREDEVIVNENQEIADCQEMNEGTENKQMYSGKSIKDEPVMDKLPPVLIASYAPAKCSQADSLVQGLLYSDNDDCSDDGYPIHNANSVSSLLSSQAELLNTQQREKAKEEMEKIAQQIKDLEATMKKKKIDDVQKGGKTDKDFSSEGINSSESEITIVSGDEIEHIDIQHPKESQIKLAKGRFRILRPVESDSDTDGNENEYDLVNVGNNTKSIISHKMLGISNAAENFNSIETSGWRSTPPSSNSCLKSPSQSLLHSPRSPSPPPPVSANTLLDESPAELKEMLSSINTVVQEYRSSRRKRKTIEDSAYLQHRTPKRPRVHETKQKLAAPCDDENQPVECPPIKVEKNCSFVASGLSRVELKQVEQLAQKSGFPFASKFNNNTTHVIVKTDINLVCERTLKYFLGIAGKKWIISFKWVQDSLKSGYLLPEENYEVIGDVASGTNHLGPKKSRMQKALLLQEYDICCIGEFTMLTKDQLKQLLELTGVTKVSHPTMFSFNLDRKPLIIAQADADQEPINFKALFRKFEVPVVSREWILDSIAPYVIQPLEDYLLCDVPNHVFEKY